MDKLPNIDNIIFQHIENYDDDFDEQGPKHIEREYYFITKNNNVYTFMNYEYFCSYKRRYYDPSNNKYVLVLSKDFTIEESKDVYDVLHDFIVDSCSDSLKKAFNEFKKSK